MSPRRQLAAAGALLAAVLGSAGFIAAYFTGGDRLYEGVAIAIAIAAAGLCAAALGWAFWIVPPDQVTDKIETYPSPLAERTAEGEAIVTDLRAVSRPHALVYLLYAALGTFAAALIVPIRSLGPAPADALFHTRWRRGTPLVREDGSVINVTSLNLDSAVTAFPQGAIGDAQSQVTLIRLPDEVAGSARGFIAYSRLCTHAGCPVALYRAAARELLCPCHQSVFDVVGNGAVVSGPADHALPRLPIAVAADGTLVATGDFPEPVGPSFWERG